MGAVKEVPAPREILNGKGKPRAAAGKPAPWWEELLPGAYFEFEPGLLAGLVTVTPEAAEYILEHKNEGNRKLYESHALRLGRDMAAARWQLTGETIIFETDGNTLNGQNRLHGCAASGTPFKTFVVIGIDKKAQETMDQGKLRSAADVLSMLGENNSRSLGSAMVALVPLLRTGMLQRQSNTSLSITEKLELLVDHPDLRKSVTFLSNDTNNVFHSRASATALHYVTWRIAPNLSRDFYKALMGLNVPDGERWQAAQRLLGRLVKARTRAGGRWKLSPQEGNQLLVKAWNCFYESKPCGQLIYKPSEDVVVSGWSSVDWQTPALHVA